MEEFQPSLYMTILTSFFKVKGSKSSMLLAVLQIWAKWCQKVEDQGHTQTKYGQEGATAHVEFLWLF